MTQQDLGRELDSSGELGSLFDASPAPEVQTSAAAETAFVLGLFGLLAVPFTLSMALSVGLAAVALVCSIVGLARASKRGYSGSVLASLGLVMALGTLALVGLRYAGIETTFGDDAVPSLHDALDWLNGLLPTP